MNPQPLAAPTADPLPSQPLHHLDVLWVQVSGTLCNLACTHCFVTSGPSETRLAMMSRADVRSRVAEALALGVREVYFTGGEPFLHPDMDTIVADTLALAPVTVLTNGTLFTARRIAFLAALARASRYSLEFRVSLDGSEAAAHDAVRGAGTWRRALDGMRALRAAGLDPIVTVTHEGPEDPAEVAQRHLRALDAEGLAGARLKLLPVFRIGREAERSRPYGPGETLATLAPGAFDPHRLQCGSCRAVSARGVSVCPLLVDETCGHMGDSLAAAARPFPLAHPACSTCWRTGMTCANG